MTYRTTIRWGFTVVLLGALLVLLGRGAAGTTRPAQGATETTLKTFTKEGAHSWTVPSGVTSVTFVVYGASGGNVVDGGVLYAVGGAGGETVATFGVRPGEIFAVQVGGRGGDSNGVTGGSSGTPDGRAGADGDSQIGALGGGGGGGSSSVSIGNSGDQCARTPPCPWATRFVVAGGGGGASATVYNPADGGAGGGFLGSDGQSYDVLHVARGGGQDQGGAGADATTCYQSSCDGTFGFGGYGFVGGGGGGGGWYGGGGGWDGETVNGFQSPASAAGGSGYYQGLALSGSFPGGARTGNGRVTIRTP